WFGRRSAAIPGEALPSRVRAFHLTPLILIGSDFQMQPRTHLAIASPLEDPMRANVWPLLLVLTSTLCAQIEPPPRPVVPLLAVDPSRLPKPGDTISTRELLIPPKAMKELQRSQTALHSGDIRSSAEHLEKALQIYPHYLE